MLGQQLEQRTPNRLQCFYMLQPFQAGLAVHFYEKKCVRWLQLALFPGRGSFNLRLNNQFYGLYPRGFLKKKNYLEVGTSMENLPLNPIHPRARSECTHNALGKIWWKIDLVVWVKHIKYTCRIGRRRIRAFIPWATLVGSKNKGIQFLPKRNAWMKFKFQRKNPCCCLLWTENPGFDPSLWLAIPKWVFPMVVINQPCSQAVHKKPTHKLNLKTAQARCLWGESRTGEVTLRPKPRKWCGGCLTAFKSHRASWVQGLAILQSRDNPCAPTPWVYEALQVGQPVQAFEEIIKNCVVTLD